MNRDLVIFGPALLRASARRGRPSPLAPRLRHGEAIAQPGEPLFGFDFADIAAQNCDLS
jgi:hypothetical protein